MAEIRHFPCYNRPVKSGRIRHQSGTMGVYPRVSFSVLLQDDTPMSTLFATTVANAKPQDRDSKLSDGGGARKSAGEGKSVRVGVDPSVGRIMNKNTTKS